MHLGRWAAPRLGAGVIVAAVMMSGCTADTPAPHLETTTSQTSALPAPSGPDGIGPTVGRPGESPPPASGTPTSGRDDEPQPPAVVGLDWLGPRPDAPGVTTTTGAGERWQGRTPGEYATIDDGGHQWFGADGSVVGCTAAGACVGIDAKGFTAVAPQGGPRLVYTPNGKPLGRFSANGNRLRGGALPTMASAVADTEVDLAGLLDAATRSTPFAGGVTGDPHFLTGAGYRFSTQLTGEYQARTGDPQHEIQVRLEPLQHQPNVSVVTAAAVRTGETVVQLNANGALTIDGQTVETTASFEQHSLPDGVELGRWVPDDGGAGAVAMVWPDRSSVVLTADPDLGMTVVLMAERAGEAAGLFGAGNLDPAQDLQDRSGLSLETDTVVRDWLVPADASLFDRRVEPDLGFPAEAATVPPAAEPFARRACASHGITVAADLSACVFDVGLTGDDGFVTGHAAMARPATRGIAAPIARRWPALQWGGVDGAQALPDLIDIELSPRERRTYRVELPDTGSVEFEFVSGCRDDVGAYPQPGEPAVRLFDRTGRPVSARLSTCGQPEVEDVPAGEYYLVVAGPSGGKSVGVRMDVHLP